jgi:septum formation protein
MQLILGSQSPRRREILQFFSLPFQQISPNFDEESLPFDNNPQEYVHLLAQGKLDSLAPQFPNNPVLTADTIVHLNGKLYGKPQNSSQGMQFLDELCGNCHSVWTALALSFNGKKYRLEEETKVFFRSLTTEQKQHYLHSLPLHDKAGGYMIQGAGGIIVERLEGCYYNVMGLPINALHSILLNANIDLWEYLK